MMIFSEPGPILGAPVFLWGLGKLSQTRLTNFINETEGCTGISRSGLAPPI